METLGAKLKLARETNKLGQKDVERMTGISFKTISNYENNRSEPDVEKLSLLCKAYNMPADYFISDDFESLHTFNFFLHRYEREIMKKYRALDEHGKEVTDYILNAEYTRCLAPKPTPIPLPETVEEEQDPYYNVIPFRNSEQPVSAGTGVYLGPESFDSLMVRENELTSRGSFGVPVSGDSMEPHYHDGDILIVEKCEELELGEIGVFTLNGEGYVKQLGHGELISLNPKYKPIPMNESILLNGRVIGILDPEWIKG